ncbi:MAG: hypothetical protein NTY19_16140 [Planctomycetota bacterium]|nr:hypothetical protein [Planctomycetota bacterium]
MTSGTFESWVAPREQLEYADPLLAELKQKLVTGKQRLMETIQFVKQRSTSYLDLSGRRLVDSAIAVIVGHLFLGQAVQNERKKRVARRYIDTQMCLLRANCEQVLAGDVSPLEEYEILAGPVPSNQ